jgi:hypothetical protein
MTSCTYDMPRSACSVALETYHGASIILRILDWLLWIIDILDFEDLIAIQLLKKLLPPHEPEPQFCVHTSLPQDYVLSQMTAIRILTSYFSTNNFNIIPTSEILYFPYNFVAVLMDS